MHGTQGSARIMDGVEQVVALHAGQTVGGRNPLSQERRDDRVASWYLDHHASPGVMNSKLLPRGLPLFQE
jgi:hypothetical protein